MNKTSAERQALWRSRHPEAKWKLHNNHIALKTEVLTHYGDNKLACVMCGEDRIQCLSIDHIEGGGNKQRGRDLRSSGRFYIFLKRGGYPCG